MHGSNRQLRDHQLKIHIIRNMSSDASATLARWSSCARRCVRRVAPIMRNGALTIPRSQGIPPSTETNEISCPNAAAKTPEISQSLHIGLSCCSGLVPFLPHRFVDDDDDDDDGEGPPAQMIQEPKVTGGSSSGAAPMVDDTPPPTILFVDDDSDKPVCGCLSQ